MESLSGSRAAIWANATSLTSTTGKLIFGMAGNLLFMRRDMNSTLWQSLVRREGP